MSKLIAHFCFLVQNVHRLSVFLFTDLKPRVLLLDVVVLSSEKHRLLKKFILCIKDQIHAN